MINKFRKRHGPFVVSSWKKINKKVKHEISMRLLFNQSFKCVYCERYLTGMGVQIDHFADKARYPQFSFVTINLFAACSFCNSSVKSSHDSIDGFNMRYDLCAFSIIHPYKDNPDVEIVFQDIDRIYLDVNRCTARGRATIELFGFADVTMTMIRAKQLIFERLHPLTTDEQRQLIQASITYRS